MQSEEYDMYLGDESDAANNDEVPKTIAELDSADDVKVH